MQRNQKNTKIVNYTKRIEDNTYFFLQLSDKIKIVKTSPFQTVCFPVKYKAEVKKTKKLSKKQKALETYKIFLKDKNSDDAFPKNEFGLMDINKDGVPELVVTPDNMYHANIYGYVNGKIKDIGYAFSGKCEFYPKKSLYYMTSTHTGDDTRSYYIYDGKKMKSLLKEKIPAYMVPKNIKFLDKMPMTANGKLDRKKLEAGLI